MSVCLKGGKHTGLNFSETRTQIQVQATSPGTNTHGRDHISRRNAQSTDVQTKKKQAEKETYVKCLKYQHIITKHTSINIDLNMLLMEEGAGCCRC